MPLMVGYSRINKYEILITNPRIISLLVKLLTQNIINLKFAFYSCLYLKIY